jgi:DNA replication protein DnaC
LVLVDELGYVPFSREAAQLLFEFFSYRYETRATALTTNLPLALLDRLTHRSHVLVLTGESYRLKESRRRASPKDGDPKPPKGGTRPHDQHCSPRTPRGNP